MQLDPALPALSVSSSGTDVPDQSHGIDRGVFPSNRVFSVGFSVGF